MGFDLNVLVFKRCSECFSKLCDDGYKDGEQEEKFDSERGYRCGEFGDPYEDGFMDGCQLKDSRDVCELSYVTRKSCKR